MRRSDKVTAFGFQSFRLGRAIFLVLTLFFAAVSTKAYDLASEFKIQLKEKDRVLGSLRGSFLIYGRPNIKMYDIRGNQFFSLQIKNNVKPVMSPDGQHLGLITYADHSPTDLKTTKLEMYDRRGKYIWKIDNPPANDFYITNKGSFFGIDGVQGISNTRVHVYDQFGDRINILVFDKYRGFLPSPLGDKFIVDQGRDGLVVHDSLGHQLALLPAAQKFMFDRNERYLATFDNGTFRLYQDEKEVTSFRFSEPLIQDMIVDVEANLAVLVGERKLQVFELTSKSLKWEYTLLEDQMNFTSVDLSPDGQRFVCGVDVNFGNSVPKEERHTEGYIYVFSIEGQSLIRHRESYNTWATGMPRAVFSLSGGSLIVQTGEKLEKFRLK